MAATFTRIGFLDDLFVDPAARGAKVGERLLDRLNEMAPSSAAGFFDKIRWITGDDNYRARTPCTTGSTSRPPGTCRE